MSFIFRVASLKWLPGKSLFLWMALVCLLSTASLKRSLTLHFQGDESCIMLVECCLNNCKRSIYGENKAVPRYLELHLFPSPRTFKQKWFLLLRHSLFDSLSYVFQTRIFQIPLLPLDIIVLLHPPPYWSALHHRVKYSQISETTRILQFLEV